MLLTGFSFESPDGIDLHRIRDGLIAIGPRSPQSPDWYKRKFNRVRQLLSFLTGLPIESKSIVGVLNEADGPPDHVYIYHQVQPPKLDETNHHKMAFSLECLGDRLPAMFKSWFNLDEDEQVPFSLCQNVINSEGNYPILDFLALVYALESYYRYKYKGDPGLYSILKKLRRKLPGYLRDELQLSSDFLKSVADSRNHYSHYDLQTKKDKDILEGDRLDNAICRLIPFIAYFLARKLTIPDEVIRKAFDYKRKGGFELWQRPWPVNPKPVEQEQPAET